MAEWLGRGLQSLVQQFDSAPRLFSSSERNEALQRLAALGGARRFPCLAGVCPLELARERHATHGEQDGRNGDQTERDSRRYEEGDNGSHDHERGERGE